MWSPQTGMVAVMSVKGTVHVVPKRFLMTTDMDLVNQTFGTHFTIGDTVIYDRAKHDYRPGRATWVGMIVGNDDVYIRIMRDGESVPYPACFYPPQLQRVGDCDE